MIATRFNRFTTYVVLLAFAATALYPLISILFLAFHKKTDDLAVMLELVEAASPAERDSYAKELDTQAGAMVKELDQLEIDSFLTGQFDRNNAIFSIQSGAGAPFNLLSKNCCMRIAMSF